MSRHHVPTLVRVATSTLVALAWASLAASMTGAATGSDDGPEVGLDRLAAPGPYAVEAREVVVPRPGDEGGDFEARLFIPLLPGADGTSGPAPASPIAAFGHGFLTPVGLYESTLRHLASWGITTIAPRSSGGPLPDHAAFAADLSAALAWVATEAGTAADWPGLPLDPEARATSGHSMGGGAAVLAAVSDARIDRVATLAAADTRPSAIEAAASLTVPALFVAASDDRITPVESHQRPMAEAATRARLHVIEGGSHCGFLDREILPGLVCDEAAIDPADQRARSRAALVAWLHDPDGGEPAAATEVVTDSVT